MSERAWRLPGRRADPMIVDLQVQLQTDDGSRVDPGELMQTAQRAGLDGLVLTEPGELSPELDGYREAAAEVGIKVYAGAEVVTNHGLILCVLPAGQRLQPDFAAKDGEVYDGHAVIDAVEDLGGVTVAVRPYDRDVALPMGDHLFSLQGLVACDVLNAQVSEIANDLALEAATNMEMPCVGISSSKGSASLGGHATLFKGEMADETELCEALRSGACWPVSFSDSAPQPEPARRARGGRSEPRDGGGRTRGRKGRSGGRRKGGGRSSGGAERGNVAPRRGGPVPDDIGNRLRPEEDDPPLDENIGNRLAPGEVSPFAPKPIEVEEEVEDDDSFGNR